MQGETVDDGGESERVGGSREGVARCVEGEAKGERRIEGAKKGGDARGLGCTGNQLVSYESLEARTSVESRTRTFIHPRLFFSRTSTSRGSRTVAIKT